MNTEYPPCEHGEESRVTKKFMHVRLRGCTVCGRIVGKCGTRGDGRADLKAVPDISEELA